MMFSFSLLHHLFLKTKAVGVCGIVWVTSSPGLTFPKTAEVALFINSHPMEQYDLEYKEEFASGAAGDGLLEFGIHWGVVPIDNGVKLNPADRGYTEWVALDGLYSEESQEWLMTLCADARLANGTIDR